MAFRSGRILGAPLLLLGVAVLFALLRGGSEPRTPEELIQHLSAAGYPCVLSEPWQLEDFGEICWTVRAGDRVFTLRRAASVMQAAAEHRALSKDSQDFPVNLYYGKFEVYRNEAYLLELLGNGDATTAAIGEAFENW